MSTSKFDCNIQCIPSHPQPGPAFADWFKALTDVLAEISPCDIMSPTFKNVAISFCNLKLEVIYELESKANRSATSVYDRSDYVVRELLRTTRLNHVIDFLKQVASLMANNKFTLDDNGVLLYDKTQVDQLTAVTLLIEIPSMLALCFTAQETVGIVSIPDVLKIAKDVLQFGLNQLLLSVKPETSQHTIFTAVLSIITSCLENLKVLNTKLFFTLFEEEELFQLLVQFILKSNSEKQTKALNGAIACMSSYIQASQSEPTRKQLESNEQFVADYKRMMDEVVNPKIKESRNARAQFRSILCYSRSLRV